jgi:hypothetical protein
MRWGPEHTKTAVAGLVSLAGAALLFRPPSFGAGVVTVLLVTVSVLVTNRIWERKPRRR